jgi:DNA-binding transcriptional MocR family regulator
MLNVNIDRSGPGPLHDQVAAQIRRAIAEGEAGPGDRLPLAKDLAAVLGVNKNTVLRALHLLREEVPARARYHGLRHAAAQRGPGSGQEPRGVRHAAGLRPRRHHPDDHGTPAGQLDAARGTWRIEGLTQP